MTDSFVFYRSFAEALDELEPEQYQSAARAIMRYALDGKEPEELTGGAKITFIMAKPIIDANAQRRENGAKGGRPKKPTVTPRKTIGYQIKNLMERYLEKYLKIKMELKLERGIERDMRTNKARLLFPPSMK